MNLETNFFFDKYSAFYETSITGSTPNRLNFRYNLIIQNNIDIIKDKRIIDIASHDGRWTFAALNAGAGFVLGIEGRSHLIENAERNFSEYGVEKSKYDFYCGDVFAIIPSLNPIILRYRFDTAFILGFFYHTPKHFELINLISKMGVKNIILDTMVVENEKPIIEYSYEFSGSEASIFDENKSESNLLIGVPSIAAIICIMAEYNYSVEIVQPSTSIPSTSDVDDYRNGKRFTLIGTKN